jgi:steroid delta-isomerase-like uncharacterized protein
MSQAADLCVRAQRELFESGNVEVAGELLSDDFVDHAAPDGAPRGADGIKGIVRMLHGAFDDLRYEIDDVFEAGDRVAMRSRVSGVHNGDLFGHPPSGRSFESQQIHIFRVAGGRIAEHWATRDDLGMFRQLGLVG